MVTPGKEGSSAVSGAKGVANGFPVKLKPFKNFINMIATELFKQCIGNNRGDDSFGNNPCCRDCTGITTFKARKGWLQGCKVKRLQRSNQ